MAQTTQQKPNVLNPLNWIDGLLQQSPAYQNYKNQTDANLMMQDLPPSAQQAGQKAGEQNAPPIGPLASEKIGPDGIERSYHPPAPTATATGAQPPASATPTTSAPATPSSSAKQGGAKPATTSGGGQESAGMQYIPNSNFFGFGGPDASGNVRDTGTGIKILQLLAGGGVNSPVAQATAQQQMLGQQKMQKKDIVERQAGIYSTQLGSFNKQIEEERANKTAMIQEQQNILKNRIFGLIGIPAYTKRYKELEEQIKESDKRVFGNPEKGTRGLMDLKGQLMGNPPQVGPTDGKSTQQKAPKGATHYSPSMNKYYDAKGKEVK